MGPGFALRRGLQHPPISHGGGIAAFRTLDHMTAEGVALILSAVATLVTALAAAIVVVLRRDVAAVHTLVNQNRTDMLAYQQDLVEALQEGGLIVPRDKSTE